MFFLRNQLAFDRRNQLNKFRSSLRSALQKLAVEDVGGLNRHLYEELAEQVTRTPLVFEHLEAAGSPPEFDAGQRRELASEPHALRVVQHGPGRFTLKGAGLETEADHFFEEGRLTLDGLFMLCHAMLELPEIELEDFASLHQLDAHPAQEALGDALLARVAVEMGYGKNEVVGYFSQHEQSYGNTVLRDYVLKGL